MKKNYVSPLAVEVNVEAESMLAASIGMGSGSVNANQSLADEHRGEWGNLWN